MQAGCRLLGWHHEAGCVGHRRARQYVHVEKVYDFILGTTRGGGDRIREGRRRERRQRFCDQTP